MEIVSIIEEIELLVRKEKGKYRNWYIGISNNPEEALLEKHNVLPGYVPFSYYMADTTEEAVAVRNYFIELGVYGNKTEAKRGERFVYIFYIGFGVKFEISSKI